MANERKSLQRYLDQIENIEKDIFHLKAIEKRRLAAEVNISYDIR